MTAAQTAAVEISAHEVAATAQEAARAFRHAAQIIASLPARAMRHLRQHAGFTSSSDKAAAYREAAAILSRHTGEPDLCLPPEPEPEPAPAPEITSPQGELFP